LMPRRCPRPAGWFRWSSSRVALTTTRREQRFPNHGPEQGIAASHPSSWLDADWRLWQRGCWLPSSRWLTSALRSSKEFTIRYARSTESRPTPRECLLSLATCPQAWIVGPAAPRTDPCKPGQDGTFRKQKARPGAESGEKPLTRLELVTSPLPRECSTAELQGRVEDGPGWI
jgi:hypothetical protein